MTFPIAVVIDPTGARRGAGQVRNELRDLQDTGNDVSNDLSRSFSRLGKTLLATLSVREVVRFGDSFQNLENRLRLVTKSANELNNVTKAIFDIAERSRQDAEATATLFQRLTQSTGELGLTQQEVLDLTESISKAIAVSGASATEAQAGMIQLSQGLAAGALRGEELNSVLEQTPAVAQVIADGLGIPLGKLKEFGAQGRITAREVISAFQTQAEGIDRQFGRTSTTIGQSLTLVKNAALELAGESSGVFEALASAIGVVANNVGLLVEAAKAFLAVWLSRVIPSIAIAAWQRLVTVIVSLRAAIIGAANGSRFFAAQLRSALSQGVLGGLLVILSNYERLGELGEDLVGGTESTTEAVSELNKELNRQRVILDDIEDQGGFGISIEGGQVLPTTTEEVRRTIAELEKQRDAEQKLLDDRVANNEKAAQSAAVRRVEEARAIQAQRSALTLFNQNFARFIDQSPVLWSKFWEGFSENAERARERFQELKQSTRDLESSLFQGIRLNRDFADTQETVRRAVRARLLTEEEGTRILQEAALAAARSFDVSRQVLGDQTLTADLATAAYVRLQEQLDSGLITLQQYRESIRRVALAAGELESVTTVPETGSIAGITTPEVVDAALPLAKEDALAFEKSITAELEEQSRRQQDLAAGAERFVDSVVEAKFAGDSLSDIFSNIATELTKAVIKAIALRAILSATGLGAPGAGGGGLVNLLPGFQRGGAFTVPGGGGTDSQVVAARITPGEVVEVRTPSQNLRRGGDGEGQGGAPAVKVVMVNNQEEAILETLRSEAGERVMVQTFDHNRRRFR